MKFLWKENHMTIITRHTEVKTAWTKRYEYANSHGVTVGSLSLFKRINSSILALRTDTILALRNAVPLNANNLNCPHDKLSNPLKRHTSEAYLVKGHHLFWGHFLVSQSAKFSSRGCSNSMWELWDG